ncbi:transketolase, partial [Bacteroidales bacterium OttesenSCG-928-C03]|nr:transketolase [Bacteroidales bacterium OttesenSCG-928-C03]
MMKNENYIRFAKEIREKVLEMIHRAKASHIGGAFSMADILSVLYEGVLNIKPDEPQWENRDRFILSKGHACTALYAALALKGFFAKEELATYG